MYYHQGCQMNINLSIKIITLLCIFPVSFTFAAQPIDQLQQQLNAINALPDHEVLCMFLHPPIIVAQDVLTRSKEKLKECVSSVSAKNEVSLLRLAHAYYSVENAIEKSGDDSNIQLREKGAQLLSEIDVAVKKREIQKNKIERDALKNANQGVCNLFDEYTFVRKKMCFFHDQGTLLLVQKKELEAKFQKKETEWQKEKQALLAELNTYKLLADGPQIEGMPQAPGGVK